MKISTDAPRRGPAMTRDAAVLGVVACLGLATPLDAEPTEDDFLDANILAIFYHELGHAVIDLLHVPIYGQEEDAADVMAVLMIDMLFEEEAAQQIAYDSAFGYITDPDGSAETAYWDVHGPDDQRYYNHVCLFYGASPEERDDLAQDLGLPGERAETCPEEFELAADSWGPLFDELADTDPRGGLALATDEGPEAARIAEVLAPEIDALNADFGFPHPVQVRIEACEEANAFYDPEDTSITFCTEFLDTLRDLHGAFVAE